MFYFCISILFSVHEELIYLVSFDGKHMTCNVLRAHK